jgi:hypothetical protein
VHRSVGHPNDYWSFAIIWRRISHGHSILCRTKDASDGQIATLTDPGRRNGNRLDCGFNLCRLESIGQRRRVFEVEFAPARYRVTGAVRGDSVSSDMGRFEG